MLTNQQVIDELLRLAKEIQESKKAGTNLGRTQEELAFYDAMTRQEATKDFYENKEQAITRVKDISVTMD